MCKDRLFSISKVRPQQEMTMRNTRSLNFIRDKNTTMSWMMRGQPHLNCKGIATDLLLTVSTKPTIKPPKKQELTKLSRSLSKVELIGRRMGLTSGMLMNRHRLLGAIQ